MLRCTECGSAKFIFTSHNDYLMKSHGAICACCHKQLNVRDIIVSSEQLSAKCESLAELHKAPFLKLKGPNNAGRL